MSALPSAGAGRPPTVVVAAVRGDYLDQAAGFTPLAEALAAGPFVVGPMTRAELRQAVTTLEDKIVQRAVAGVLNAVYEADFRGFSYGFRPGRRPHDALAAGIYRRRVNWVLAEEDADIGDFFGQLDRNWYLA